MTSLTDRLNEILPRLVSDEFLGSTGIGNEIAFYIFDYPPEEELRVRDHLAFLIDQLPKKRAGLKVRHVNLFDFILDYLRSRKLLEGVLREGRRKGDLWVKAELLKGPLATERLASFLETTLRPQDHELVLLSGVGSAYPLIRTHALLTALQPIMGRTHLIVFYPGRFDQITLRLFGKLSISTSLNEPFKNKKQESYYRAFQLVP